MVIHKAIHRTERVSTITRQKAVTCSYGFGEAWYIQGVGDVNIFLVLFKQRVMDLYLHDWFLNLEIQTKLCCTEI